MDQHARVELRSCCRASRHQDAGNSSLLQMSYRIANGRQCCGANVSSLTPAAVPCFMLCTSKSRCMLTWSVLSMAPVNQEPWADLFVSVFTMPGRKNSDLWRAGRDKRVFRAAKAAWRRHRLEFGIRGGAAAGGCHQLKVLVLLGGRGLIQELQDAMGLEAATLTSSAYCPIADCLNPSFICRPMFEHYLDGWRCGCRAACRASAAVQTSREARTTKTKGSSRAVYCEAAGGDQGWEESFFPSAWITETAFASSLHLCALRHAFFVHANLRVYHAMSFFCNHCRRLLTRTA